MMSKIMFFLLLDLLMLLQIISIDHLLLLTSYFRCWIPMTGWIQEIHEIASVINEESAQITESAVFDQHQEIACEQQ